MTKHTQPPEPAGNPRDTRNSEQAPIVGLILAGGRSLRMGSAHKPLQELGTQPLLRHIIDNASAQTDSLLLNVNADPELYAGFGLPLLSDDPGLPPGPLRGIHAGLAWTRQHHGSRNGRAPLLACFPGDTPWFPLDIVARLASALEEQHAEIAWLCTEGQLQPLFSLWHPGVEPALLEALRNGEFSPRFFIEARRNALVHLDGLPTHHFFNINDRQSLLRARALAGEAEQSAQGLQGNRSHPHSVTRVKK